MRLLLDAHIPLSVTEQLRRADIDCAALSRWHGGAFRTAADDVILTAAHDEGLVFVTYDSHTIPSMLEDWRESGQHHAGVVIIISRTIWSNDVGTLVRSLRALVEEENTLVWLDRMTYLRRR